MKRYLNRFLSYLTEFSTKVDLQLLLIFVAADLVYILGNIGFELLYSRIPFHFKISTELGFAEVFNYMKDFWIALLLLSSFLKTKRIVFFAWIPTFIYFLFDDAMQIHEEIGGIISQRFLASPIIGVRSQDIGELIVTGVVAIFLFAFITTAYIKSNQDGKRISIDFLFLVLLVTFFGVLVDIFHETFFPVKNGIGFLFMLVEDGGEMIALSLAVAYAFKLNRMIHFTNSKSIETQACS